MVIRQARCNIIGRYIVERVGDFGQGNQHDVMGKIYPKCYNSSGIIGRGKRGEGVALAAGGGPVFAYGSAEVCAALRDFCSTPPRK